MNLIPAATRQISGMRHEMHHVAAMRRAVTSRRVAVTLAAAAVLFQAGCKQQTATVDDSTLTGNVQQRIQGDSAISTEPIQISTQAGTVTLNGQVSNNAARSLAANDAASVTGVQKVINNIVIAQNTPPVSAMATTPQPQVATLPVERLRARVEPRPAAAPRPERAPAPVERASNTSPARDTQSRQPMNTTPAPPPPPALREVTLAAGTTLPVRITQTLDSATTQTGETFSGSIATDVMQDGLVVLPRGTAVAGRVVDAKDAGHFKGNSALSIQLTSVTKRGQQIPVFTDSFSKEGAGRGKNTAVKTGIGAAAGAVLGGIFGGGKGAAIGAAAGGGTGAGINAVTRGQQVQIPSETVVRFQTTNSITVRTSTRPESSSARSDRNDTYGNGGSGAQGDSSGNGDNVGLRPRQ